MTKMIVGRSSGTVICQNCFIRDAPSMAAASYSVARDGLHGRPGRSARCSRSTASRPWSRSAEPRGPLVRLPVDRVDAEEVQEPVDHAVVAPEELGEDDRTAATEVTSGSSTPMRKSVRRPQPPVERVGQRAAPAAAAARWTRTKMPKVLQTAFQNWSSAEQPRVVVQADELVPADELPVVQRDPERVAEREQAEDEEQQEERRDVEVGRERHVQPRQPGPPSRPPGRRRCPGAGRGGGPHVESHSGSFP